MSERRDWSPPSKRAVQLNLSLRAVERKLQLIRRTWQGERES